MPPPVPPGEAPINIRNMSKNWDAKVSSLILMVVKPAVREFKERKMQT